MYKFENIKITAEFETSVIFEKNPFDGVLAYLYAQELQKQGKYKEFEFKMLELPFVKKTNGIYHTSWAIIEDKKIFIENNVIIKAFPKKLYEQIGKNPNQNIDIQRGKFKGDTVNFERQMIEKISWYVCGDYTKIKELIENFTHFGKKSSLDCGKIKRITMEKIEQDYSLMDKDGNVNRPLPTKDFSNLKIKDKERKAIMKPIYPYWDRFGREECYL